MDLATTYLGLKLPHPLMSGASPLVDDLDVVRRLEDAGVAAITMHSLFEEQLTRESERTVHDVEHAAALAESSSFLPRPTEYRLGPYAYLEQIRRIKAAVKVPVIGSLNGTTNSGWLNYAKLIQQAGADALELNVYYVASDQNETGDAVENRTLDMVKALKATVTLPVAVKLSPYYSSLAHFAKKLEGAGVDALVLFNRFYQPDIDIETLETVPKLQLSDSSELLLRLRWLALLSGRVQVDLCATGGVHTAADALKAVMAGASGVQMVSSLLVHGPEHLGRVKADLTHWLETHEYESLAQARGSMNHLRNPDPSAFERGNYIKTLQTWRPE